MHSILSLALLLCSPTTMKQECGPAVPDDSLFRTDERFEVAVRGVTGAHINVREEVFAGRHCSVLTATREGMPVVVDILIHEGEKGKKLLELRLVEVHKNNPATVVDFSDLLAPGESHITGSGWNNLFELRLTQK